MLCTYSLPLSSQQDVRGSCCVQCHLHEKEIEVLQVKPFIELRPLSHYAEPLGLKPKGAVRITLKSLSITWEVRAHPIFPSWSSDGGIPFRVGATCVTCKSICMLASCPEQQGSHMAKEMQKESAPRLPLHPHFWAPAHQAV